MEGWLSKQPEFDTIKLAGKDQSIQLVKTWTLDHVQERLDIANTGNRFAMSETGAVGLSCSETPYLSVMYPDTDKAAVVLSDTKVFRSATFVKVSGKEYLASSCGEDNCLYLWDIESETSKKVFNPKLPKDKVRNCMFTFKMNENTIGYGEVHPSLDGSRRVFILNTDTDELTLSSSLKLFTAQNIWDMCSTNLEDGTACLLLCVPHDHRVMAVEMTTGETRWEAGEEQMGEKFDPWSICTDENNTVYVADYHQDMIHVLFAEDGTLMKRLDVGSYYDIYNIFIVRFHDEHLYAEAKIHNAKYAISKFKRIAEY